MDYHYTLIIPHYNIPDLLERLLQTIPIRDDLQIIVVDDCSPDNCNVKLNQLRLKFPNVEFYSTGTNGGGGKARNVGLKYAKGKYILFADADDYFEDNFNDLLDKYCNQIYDIVYFSAIFETEEDNLRYYDNYINKFIWKALKSKAEKDLKFMFTQPWCKLIRNELITTHSINFEESSISNDVFFSTRVDYYAKTFQIDPSQSYVWKIRKTSTSRELNPQKILKRLEIDLIRHNFIKSLGRHDHINYLAMIEYIYISKDPDLKRSALEICKKFNISKKEIFIVRLKRVLRTLLK